MSKTTNENSCGSKSDVTLSLTLARQKRVERLRTQVLTSIDVLQRANGLTNGEMLHILATALTRLAKNQIKHDSTTKTNPDNYMATPSRSGTGNTEMALFPEKEDSQGSRKEEK